ncbi:MAG: HD domain-containing protein [Lachnospiraceae bacterium]|nr:HD domain-containing protein [Lachnospiraceae bacterium]
MSFQMNDRVNRIWSHPMYQEQYQLLQECEKTREFCGHTLEHFLAVGRLMWIYNLESQAGLDKELIYAAALLHDIGRGLQYKDGIPHDEAGVKLSEVILPECGFQDEEIQPILAAIGEHRQSGSKSRTALLGEYLYRADKACRNCLVCPAEKECNWSAEKKNMMIKD